MTSAASSAAAVGVTFSRGCCCPSSSPLGDFGDSCDVASLGRSSSISFRVWRYSRQSVAKSRFDSHALIAWASRSRASTSRFSLRDAGLRHRQPPRQTRRLAQDGRTEWIPPPQLDTGQARVNNYHHPERYLIPDEAEADGDLD